MIAVALIAASGALSIALEELPQQPPAEPPREQPEQPTRDAEPAPREDAESSADAPASVEQPAAEPVEDLAIFDTDDRDIVKRGRNNVCRDRNDLGFDDVLHFRAYRSKADCLRSGGREPR